VSNGFQPSFQNGQLLINYLPLPYIRRRFPQQALNGVVRCAGVGIIPACRLLNPRGLCNVHEGQSEVEIGKQERHPRIAHTLLFITFRDGGEYH